MTELKIEQWPIDRLTPYARNPRRNDDAVPRMAGLIKEFGFKVPIVVRSDGEVIDGHLRLKAARHLGLETVPVVLADDWTPAQVKAFRLAVNKSAEWAEWDEELLALEIEDLKLEDFDLELIGIDEDDVNALDEYPELPEGEKESATAMSFSLTDEQVETVKNALQKAKKLYQFEDTGNENSNGNALAKICEVFLGIG